MTARVPDNQRPSADAAVRRRIPDDVFPPRKPPFVAVRLLVSPEGDVWIPRSAAWDAESSVVDVVGRDGRLRRQIRLPANRRIVAFGRAAVYVAAIDDDDLEWLERVPLVR
jgi:hypothetical protein